MSGIQRLDPDERALAERLARLEANAAPPPALDARILAAAHDGVARAPAATRTHRHRPRWPVALGVAASLLLAVGLAWRLRPLPGPSPRIPDFDAGTASQAQPVTSASPASDITASAMQPTDAAPLASARVVADAQPRAKATTAREAAIANSAPAPVPVPAIRMPPPPPSEPAVVFDQAPLPPPPAPPAPAAAPAPSAFPTANAADATAAQAQAAPARAAASTAAERANAADSALPETRTLDRLATGARKAGTSGAGDEPGSDVPPATMASPQARDAWLARIRELVAGGHVDAARDSLQEFKRRYPAYPLPADLRALAPPSGSSPR